jgi:dolichol-phosphate mannosyltransferase
VNLTRNFGSYNAFLAGMEYSEADAHVHLHADLQDPPELIEDMTMHWLAGEKLVIAYRIAREDGSIFSTLYHALVQRYAIRGIPSGGFDLMLFDEQLRQEVVRISEKSTNVVYLISWLGFPFKAIPYKRLKRESGESQWKWSKKVRLFFDTFFSFSDIPASAVRWMSAMLMVLAAAAVVMALWYGSPSRAELLLAIVAAMIALLGLIGVILCEYLVRIHETVRRRPNAVVESVHG